MPTKTHSPVQGTLTNTYAQAAERYANVRKAYSASKASCDAVNAAQRALDDALYDLSNPPLNGPVCTGRER